MNALAPISPKLGNLIPLLGSDKDGEVVAAARAICRTLRGSGLDLHDLAELVRKASNPSHSGRQDEGPQDWERAIRWCLTHGSGRLAPKEWAFLNNVLTRVVVGTDLTPKQSKWLEDIVDRLGGPL